MNSANIVGSDTHHMETTPHWYSVTGVAQFGTAGTIPMEVGVVSAHDLYALRTTTDVRCTLSSAYGDAGIAMLWHSTLTHSVRRTCTVANS